MVQDHMVLVHMVPDHKSRPESQKKKKDSIHAAAIIKFKRGLGGRALKLCVPIIPVLQILNKHAMRVFVWMAYGCGVDTVYCIWMHIIFYIHGNFCM